MPEIKTGDIIAFGKYNWRVLDVQDGKALIITERIIELRVFHRHYSSNSWQGCDLCEYLNGAFYDAFSPAEQNRVAPTLIECIIKPRYPKSKDNFSTHRIFVLNEEEAEKYFKDEDDRIAKYEMSIDEARAFYENDEERMAEYGTILDWAWWLRDSANFSCDAYCVSANGRIDCDIIRDVDRADVGVRPALWLEIAQPVSTGGEESP